MRSTTLPSALYRTTALPPHCADQISPAVTATIKKIKTKTTIVHADEDRVIERVDMELELYDKGAAIDKAMRHLGLLRDRVEHTGPDGGPIEVREVIIELPKATKNGKTTKRRARRVRVR